VLSDLSVGPFVGVDVSSRMLAQAAAKQVDAELREADLTQMLAEDVTCWKLIVASDVLVYFGALSDVLASVHSRIEPGGWFIFTVEELLPDHDGIVHGNGDWALGGAGRYTHSRSHVINPKLPVAEDIEA
jgi:predicted TPR repeat methyltransferase